MNSIHEKVARLRAAGVLLISVAIKGFYAKWFFTGSMPQADRA